MSFDPKKVAKHRVVFLHGEESTLRREALEALLAELGVAKDDFDLESFDADSTAASNWMASAGTAPFMAERRITVVRHILRCEPDKVKAAELAALPESSFLVLVADDEPNAEDKATKFNTISTGWRKHVEAAKGAVVEFKADPEQSKRVLRAMVEASGKSLSTSVLEMLLEMTGGSLSRSMDELQKVILYVGEKAQIQESDLKALVIPSRDWNIFKLVDAVTAGQIGEALRQLRILVGSSQKAEDAAFRQILPMVSRQMKLLWQARVCLDAKCQPHEAPPEILRTFLEKPNISSEKPYRLGKLMEIARRTPLSRLTLAMQTLSDTDARLKGIESGFNSMDTLERMVLELADALAPKVQTR